MRTEPYRSQIATARVCIGFASTRTLSVEKTGKIKGNKVALRFDSFNRSLKYREPQEYIKEYFEEWADTTAWVATRKGCRDNDGDGICRERKTFVEKRICMFKPNYFTLLQNLYFLPIGQEFQRSHLSDNRNLSFVSKKNNVNYFISIDFS